MDINSRFLFACSGVKGEPAGETWYTPTLSDNYPAPSLTVVGAGINPSTGNILIKARKSGSNDAFYYRTTVPTIDTWTYVSSGGKREGLVYTGTRWISDGGTTGPGALIQSTNDGSSWGPLTFPGGGPSFSVQKLYGTGGNNLAVYCTIPSPTQPIKEQLKGTNSTYLKFSNNGGSSWYSSPLVNGVPPAYGIEVNSLHHLGGNEWVVRKSPSFNDSRLISTNNGSSFTTFPPPAVAPPIFCAVKDNNGNYLIGGSNGVTGTPISSSVNGLVIVDNNNYTIWAVGSTVYTDSDGLVNGAAYNNPQYIVGTVFLYQVENIIISGSYSPATTETKYTVHY